MSGDFYRSSPSSHFRSFSHDEDDEITQKTSYYSSSSSHHSSPNRSSPSKNESKISLSTSRLSPNEREKYSVYEEFYSHNSTAPGGNSPQDGSRTFSSRIPTGQNSYSFRKKRKEKQHEMSITRKDLIGIVASAILSLFLGFLLILSAYFLFPIAIRSIQRSITNFSGAFNLLNNHRVTSIDRENSSKVIYVYDSSSNTFSIRRKKISLSSLYSMESEEFKDLELLTSCSSKEQFSILKPISISSSTSSSSITEPELLSLSSYFNFSLAANSFLTLIDPNEELSLSSSLSSQFSPILFLEQDERVEEENLNFSFSDLFQTSCLNDVNQEQTENHCKSPLSHLSNSRSYFLRSKSLFHRFFPVLKDQSDLFPLYKLLAERFSKVEEGKISLSSTSLSSSPLSSSPFFYSSKTFHSLLLNGRKLWIAFPSEALPANGYSLLSSVSSWLKFHEEFEIGADEEEEEEKEVNELPDEEKIEKVNFFANFQSNFYDKKFSEFIRDFSSQLYSSTSSLSRSPSSKIFLILQNPGDLLSFPGGWIYGFISLDRNYSSPSLPQVSLDYEGDELDSTQALYYFQKAIENLQLKNYEESVKMYKILNFFDSYKRKSSGSVKDREGETLTSNVMILELLYELSSEIFQQKLPVPEDSTQDEKEKREEKRQVQEKEEKRLLLKLLSIILEKNPQNYRVIGKIFKILLDESLDELASQEKFFIKLYERCLLLIKEYNFNKEIFNNS